MNKENKHIIVFEHEVLRTDRGEKKITKEQFEAFQRYCGSGTPYYSLIYNGVQFNEYVGVIQIGDTLIEVLPKADKLANTKSEQDKWRDILIDMLRAVGSFEIQSTSSSNLKIKPNSILDLYIEMYIKEVEYLLHNGLAKKYRKNEGNVTALKGSLQFGKHIQQNITHEERFYVKHTVYDVEHQLHFILYKAIKLIKQINTNASLHSRIGTLLLNFPEMPDIKVTESTFEKLVFNRKTQHYTQAIEIAKLLLLQYHPDLSKGRNHVLALMFDMNKLWEQFVYVSLRKKLLGYTVTAQTSKYFWKPENGNRSSIRPDILIKKDDVNYVLDTKWKNLNGYNPSPDDLRQLYVYHEYYNANKVALVYPGAKSEQRKGTYIKKDGNDLSDMECSVITMAIPDIDKEESISLVKNWQEKIKEEFESWIKKSANLIH